MAADMLPPLPNDDDNWLAEHFDDGSYVKAAEDPQELADMLTKDELQKMVSAATAEMVQATWDQRASRFIKWLNGKERIWFG